MIDLLFDRVLNTSLANVMFSVDFNSFITEVPIILELVYWFAKQINGLVSI